MLCDRVQAGHGLRLMTATDMWALHTSECENRAWLSAKKGRGTLPTWLTGPVARRGQRAEGEKGQRCCALGLVLVTLLVLACMLTMSIVST